jgi:hypothetical protein
VSRLVVLASASAQAPPALDGWVLRLAGVPDAAESSPPDVMDAADEATAQLTGSYPQWLWDWARTSGALELHDLPGAMSWWWYTPVSEKSCVRSRLVTELYWMTLLKVVLRRHPNLEVVDWIGDDPEVAAVARQVVEGACRRFHAVTGARARAPSLIGRRVVFSLRAIARWTVLRLAGGGSRSVRDSDVVIFTRYPSLWETADDTHWHERAFGTLPQFLADRGHRVTYVAQVYGSVRRLLEQRGACARERIVIIEATLPLTRVLRAHLTPRLFSRYLQWFRRQRARRVMYDDLDVTALLWREMHTSVLSPEVPGNIVLATGLTKLLASGDQAPITLLAYEYQPSERAVAAAVHSRSGRALVGVQVAMYNPGQMGWGLGPDEAAASTTAGKPDHMPDLLAAYGELPYRTFARAVGPSRVALVGPIRYPHLRAGTPPSGPAPSVIALPVATSSTPEEALALVEGAIAVGAGRHDVALRFRFHPLLRLDDDVRRVAEAHGLRNWSIDDGELLPVLRAAPMLICAGTSTGIEAIACGCMPLVFRAPGLLSANPMLLVPDAVFFWGTAAELDACIDSCIREDDDYRERVARWPAALAAHVYQLDGGANARLYDALVDRAWLTRGVPPSDGSR